MSLLYPNSAAGAHLALLSHAAPNLREREDLKAGEAPRPVTARLPRLLLQLLTARCDRICDGSHGGGVIADPASRRSSTADGRRGLAWADPVLWRPLMLRKGMASQPDAQDPRFLPLVKWPAQSTTGQIGIRP
ncbi:uncharacterized protein BJ171DRAFT_476407 [Polychytrium aggregatum]|uniref:uncharacterized protein n=1 Tax=Polychytrium aggregatum TaxID=110093 RepID=UPI0022FE967A|nr:uncharacterized protein BJ171DRAFT_476407 [Polychytrium aggregatum]KAI9202634.1 hypothetical protein BJ171DRAFT_476407 [Polychytrium aggregatum]